MSSPNHSIPLRIEIIRIDTRYNSVKGNRHKASRTAGVLLVNGHFMSDTIEDYDYGWDENTTDIEIRSFKKRIDPNTKQPYLGRTAIPSGEYFVTLSNSAKFGNDALLVSKKIGSNDIPGFDGIRIHAGANSGFTEGCIIVGTSSVATDNVFTSYESIYFDRKLGTRANSRWTPHWLQDIIRMHGRIATLTIRRNYPSQALCDYQEQKKKQAQCLQKLVKYRNDTLVIDTIIKAPSDYMMGAKPFKPFPSRNTGGR